MQPSRPQEMCLCNNFYIKSNIVFTFFLESFVFICDFHREQSWTRWVSKIDNGASEAKGKVLSMLRRCAHSCSLKEYNDAITKLKESKEWLGNSRLRNWFSKTWITENKVCTVAIQIYTQ